MLNDPEPPELSRAESSETGKRRVGRPRYVPVAALGRRVETFASYGIPDDDIARELNIHLSTLRKYYREQLRFGRVKTNAQVAGFLFNAAKRGNVTAMIFWLKCRAGWVDATAVAAALGKKEAALVEARNPDAHSPFGKVLAARAKRNVGSKLSGLGNPADGWPVTHSRSTTQ